MQENILLTVNMIMLLRHGSYLHPEQVKSLIKNKQKNNLNFKTQFFL